MFFKIIKAFYKRNKKALSVRRGIFKDIFWEDNTDNLYYGHYNILKRYSKILLPYKINGELQHGWSANSGIPSLDLKSKNESLKLKRYYVFNDNNKKKCLNAGYQNVITIGAPFIYLEDPNKFHRKQIPRSLILFPTHTHEWFGFLDPVNSYKNYIINIKRISPFFTKVTVMLGWKEYQNKKIISLFNSASISVMTLGHRDNNPSFLIKFIRYVSEYEYMSSDAFSSAVFYSLFIKKKVFIYGELNKKGEIWQTVKTKNKHEFYSRLYPQLLWENFDHKSHFDIADEELGSKFKLSQEALRKIFGWNFRAFVNRKKN